MNAAQLGLQSGQEPFEGEYRAKMFELVQAGFTPWSTENIMDARNAVPSEYPLWNNYFDTDFGIAGTKKKIYLAPYSARLRAVTPQTRLTYGGGGLPLREDALDEARTYNRNDLILDRNLTEEEARGSQVWLDFADGDQKRVEKYVENTFRFGKDRFNYDKMMGIFVPQDKEPIERAVVLGSLYDRSRADGGNHLGSYARFVGVRRGAPQARAPKNGPYRTPAENKFVACYDTILADPKSAVEALNDKTAASLAGLLQKYLATRVQ